MHFPEDLRYAATHEWARIDHEGAVHVGISDFAQDQLGDVVFVDLPEIGRSVSRGDSFGEVESTKSVSDIYAPVAGTVTATNEILAESPETINTDPYGEGWLIVITPTDLAEFDHLLDAASYEATTG